MKRVFYQPYVTVKYLVTDLNQNPPVVHDRRTVEIVNVPPDQIINKRAAKLALEALGRTDGMVWRINEETGQADTTQALRIYPGGAALWWKWRDGEWARQRKKV